MFSKIVERSITEFCKKHQLDSAELFRANLEISDYVEMKFIRPLVKDLDNSLIQKLVKWRKHFEIAKFHEIKKLSSTVIENLRAQLGQKYFVICISG